MSSSTESSSQNNVVPSEVGWQFVPQYYTFVNKQPNRLHCFYTKASTFIHGTEGEDGKPCYGQQEIHDKITSIGFEDCKVFIHSVDAQSSANGGIIIQVIGEMSNRGENWRKFVQTFFLAEQPNGYFVLNDIFRFLKEDSVDEARADSVTENEPAEVDEPTVSVDEKASLPMPDTEESEPIQPELEPESAPEVAEETPAEASEGEETTIRANGHANAEAETEAVSAPAPPASLEKPDIAAPTPMTAAVSELTTDPSHSPPPASSPAPLPADNLNAANTSTTPSTSTPALPPVASTAAAAIPAQPTPPPQPVIPPQPKTWANLAAANSKKWGSAVAQESRGTSEVPATSSSTPASGTQTPIHPSQRPIGRPPNEQSPALAAALATPTPQCFVKSVQENISEAALRQVLTTRFGQIKELEIVRSKACAFLEFVSLDAARRAIVASLPMRDGGEGGVRIDAADGSQGYIRVEVRKERGERPISRPRGGGPPLNGERGGFRGRGGPRGRGMGTK